MTTTDRGALRWLHLSDLHVRAGDGYEQDVVLKALVRSFSDGEPLAALRPDLVFCTGDVAAGGKAGEYREAARFFDALSTATGVTRDRVFVVPGNHDVDRERVSRRFRLDLTSREAAGEFFGPSADAREDRALAWRRFEAYGAFHDDLFGDPPTAETPWSSWRLQARGRSLGIVGLNTAWLAGGDVRAGDLVVGERVVRAALEPLRGAERPELVVALLHHPTEWLSEFERRSVEDLLVEGCDLVLYGHLHQERPWAVQTPMGTAGLLGAGAACQGRDPRWPNSAFVGELDGGRLRVQGLKFFDRGQGVWAPDRDLSPRTGGVIELTLGRAAVAAPAAAPVSGAPAPAPVLPTDLDRYLRHVDLTCGHITLTGLLSERAAADVPIESVYVALRASWPDAGRPGGAGRERAVGAAERGADALRALARFLERGPGGPPGDSDAPPGGAPPSKARVLLSRALEQVGVPADAARSEAVQDAAWTRLQAREASWRPRGDGGDGALAELLRTAEIDQVLRFRSHLLIEGDPGSGKTTQLKHVAVALARALGGDAARATAMGFAAPFPVPVFVELRKFAGWLAERDGARHGNGHAELLVAYLRETLGPVSGGGDWIAAAFAAGRVVVLLDGMDEVSDDKLRRLVSEALHDFIGAKAYRDCRFALTSRPAGLTAEVRAGLGELAHCKVQPLEPGQVDRFVHAWYAALIRDPQEARDRANDLVARIRASEKVAELAQTPIMLTVIAVVHQTRGSLPERRADLYEQCVNALADLWDHTRGVQRPADCPRLTLAEKRDVFQELAWEAHQRGEGGPPLERAEALEALRLAVPQLGGTADDGCRAVIEHLADRSGLVIPDGLRAYKFRHLTFQEFLAARRLCDRSTEPWEALAAEGRLADPWWREVVLLGPAVKAISSAAEATRFVRELFAVARRVEGREAQANALGLVSRALCDLRQYQVRDLATVLVDQRVALKDLLEDRAQPGDLGARVAMAEALGWFGDDPRLPEARRWLDLRPGRAWRGSESKEAFSDERPVGPVDVPAFALQRWPVTVAEYQAFRDEGGYDDSRWWDPDGWRWRTSDDDHGAPDGWSWQLGRAPNRPVVGVSWWEARAYAAWLAHETRAPARLPSEAEWERAARGGDLLNDGEPNPDPRREYPWEGPFDAVRCNSGESGLWDTTPVGLFPAGASPDGLLDMAGNVWEWCEDDWNESHDEAPADGRARVGDPRGRIRVSRGGSWAFVAWLCRASCRNRCGPGFRGVDLGFRLARSGSP